MRESLQLLVYSREKRKKQDNLSCLVFSNFDGLLLAAAEYLKGIVLSVWSFKFTMSHSTTSMDDPELAQLMVDMACRGSGWRPGQGT